MNTFKLLLICLFAAVPLWGAAPASEVKRGSFLGTWESARGDGLWCRIEFQKERGQLFTFRADKHLSTLNFWWNLDSAKEKIILGVNGDARILANGQLQLMLKPINTNIVTVRNAVLKHVPAR